MYEVKIRYIDEVFIRVEANPSVLEDIYDNFSFRPKNYKYMHKFKCGLWDGWIRLFNKKSRTIYRGLLNELVKFLRNKSYRVIVDDRLNDYSDLDEDHLNTLIKSWNLPVTPRDYQIEYLKDTLRDKRILILSATGSGKSLIIYMIVRYLQEFLGKGLIVVPTISLVSQMYKDFKYYGYDSERYCHCVTAGVDKNTDKFLTISTYQSIYNLPEEYFKEFSFLIIDECHLADAKSLVGISERSQNALYRIGTTGTLKDSKVNTMVLEGLFGPTKKFIDTKELIDRGQLSKLNIKFLIFEYPESDRKMVKNLDYSDELRVVISNHKRNQYIKNLSLSIKGNTLILYQFVEDHGRILYDLIKDNGRNTFFIHGGVSGEEREKIREIVDNSEDNIIVASYGTFSTGINIKNLDNLILASPLKSKIKNLQSIGRILRISGRDKEATVYDLVDNLSVKGSMNFLFRHFLERNKIYKKEKFSCKSFNIPFDIN